MKTKGWAYLAVMMIFLCAVTAWAGSEGPTVYYGTGAGALSYGPYDTFIGVSAGAANTSGSSNSFIGYNAGYTNATGGYNTFVGDEAGYLNSSNSANSFFGSGAGRQATGAENSFFGESAGYGPDGGATGNQNAFFGRRAGLSNSSGSNNVYIGWYAGSTNQTGNNNVFLGSQAGSAETGSNKLYIDNCYTGNCSQPLIYGEFDTRSVRINGAGIGVAGYPSYTLDVSNNGVSKSSLHFSLNGTDTGGWISSVLDNNFFLSSGATYFASTACTGSGTPYSCCTGNATGNCGWIQKSPDGNSVIAGSGGVGYRVFTTSGTAVGAVVPITPRMLIDYSDNVGFGVASLTYPLQLANGAYVTPGGTWTNASSREYKENIRELTTAEAVKTLEGLNPVKYNYKVDKADKHVGFIAEDVPDLVASKDRKGLSPMDIVAVLTKVVQEKSQEMEKQQQTIEEQKRALDEQKKAFADLAATVAQMKAEMQRLEGRNVTAMQVQ